MSGWIEDDEWHRIQASVPILCVDALPIRRIGSVAEVGLILRETPHQGRRWCLLGGRVRRDEALADALTREWQSALGNRCGMASVSGPTVIEYQPDAVAGRPHDPRQHAVALTYAVTTADEPTISGPEALAFRWFDPYELDATIMGFGQETVVATLLSDPE